MIWEINAKKDDAEVRKTIGIEKNGTKKEREK